MGDVVESKYYDIDDDEGKLKGRVKSRNKSEEYIECEA